MTAPHESAHYWTPDEVAEALGGISMATSSRLYELMPHAAEKPACEWPEPTDTTESVVALWPHLTEAERLEVNAGFEAEG
tara:strand:+ start:1065 stop:1304 length:240 start_codon:yes stop_codon:yes gene_type:complete